MSGDHRLSGNDPAARDDVACSGAAAAPTGGGKSPPTRLDADAGDSSSDTATQTGGTARLDADIHSDSSHRARADVPPSLPQLLPGEATLVYQHLRDQLSALFDQGNENEERS